MDYRRFSGRGISPSLRPRLQRCRCSRLSGSLQKPVLFSFNVWGTVRLLWASWAPGIFPELFLASQPRSGPAVPGLLRGHCKGSEGPTRPACGLTLSARGRDPSLRTGAARTAAARPGVSDARCEAPGLRGCEGASRLPGSAPAEKPKSGIPPPPDSPHGSTRGAHLSRGKTSAKLRGVPRLSPPSLPLREPSLSSRPVCLHFCCRCCFVGWFFFFFFSFAFSFHRSGSRTGEQSAESRRTRCTKVRQGCGRAGGRGAPGRLHRSPGPVSPRRCDPGNRQPFRRLQSGPLCEYGSPEDAFPTGS